MSVTTSIHRKNTVNIAACVRCYSVHTFSISATSERTKRHVCPRTPFFKWHRNIVGIGAQLKCDGTRAETIFSLSGKQKGRFKSVGASVQSTTGSRGERIRGSNGG